MTNENISQDYRIAVIAAHAAQALQNLILELEELRNPPVGTKDFIASYDDAMLCARQQSAERLYSAHIDNIAVGA